MLVQKAVFISGRFPNQELTNPSSTPPSPFLFLAVHLLFSYYFPNNTLGVVVKGKRKKMRILGQPHEFFFPTDELYL